MPNYLLIYRNAVTFALILVDVVAVAAAAHCTALIPVRAEARRGEEADLALHVDGDG